MGRPAQTVRGFTILELMVAMAIFGIICAAMFALLQLSQQKYSSETQLSGSFQEARLGVDQIVRDINISGYPSLTLFSSPASVYNYAVNPVAWDPSYPTNPNCQVAITCIPNPGDFDLILETDLGDGNGVSWIRYYLDQTTNILYRGVVPKKSAGSDPVSALPESAMTPFVENVMNSVSDPLLTEIRSQYPAMFPTGPVPIFQYTCRTPQGPLPCGSSPVNYYGPTNISDIDVTLIVKTKNGDMQTQSLRLLELTGRGHVSNASY